jgi:hypothetical protein
MVGDKTVGVDHILKFVENRPTITDEEFKVEAKRRGYNLIKIPEKVTLLPCVCGSERRDRVFVMRGFEYYSCATCGLVAKEGKSTREARLNWNAMIEEKMKDGKTD